MPAVTTPVEPPQPADSTSSVDIRQLTTGVAETSTRQPAGTTAATIPAQVFARAALDPQATAYLAPSTEEADAPLTSVTWQEFTDRIQQVAAGLLTHGISANQAVGIMSETRLEWLLVDLGAQSIGAQVTALYPAAPLGDISFILQDAQVSLLFVENDELAAKVRPALSELPTPPEVVVITAPEQRPDSLAALSQSGQQLLTEKPEVITEKVAQLSSDAVSSLVYTSGTSGTPKGVQLTHANWLAETQTVEDLDILGPADVQMMWLPLSHVFSRTFAYSQYRLGYASVVDGQVPRLMHNLAQGQPTFMPSVPRTFEKIYAGIQDLAAAKGPVAVAAAKWARRVGTNWSRAHQDGRKPSLVTRLAFPVADRILFRKVRAKLGGRMRYFVSGSAPLSVEILEFFHMCQVMILEGYGLTETAAAVTVNRPDDYRFGTAGPALSGQTIAIAADGEILVAVSGGVTTPGYLNDPEATSALIKDGWLHTGDIGELVDGRYVKITDRKRDMFKTSNGKYVAPARVEASLSATSALIGQALLHGEDRPYCVALISVDSLELERWAAARSLLGNYAELLKHPDLAAEIQAGIDRVNAALPRWEQVKRFALLPRELSVDAADITASLKLRRQVVVSRYRQLLGTLYSAT